MRDPHGIQKCIDDIKAIVLVLTNPREWEKQQANRKENDYDRRKGNRKSKVVVG